MCDELKVEFILRDYFVPSMYFLLGLGIIISGSFEALKTQWEKDVSETTKIRPEFIGPTRLGRLFSPLFGRQLQATVENCSNFEKRLLIYYYYYYYYLLVFNY